MYLNILGNKILLVSVYLTETYDVFKYNFNYRIYYRTINLTETYDVFK